MMYVELIAKNIIICELIVDVNTQTQSVYGQDRYVDVGHSVYWGEHCWLFNSDEIDHMIFYAFMLNY